MDDRMMMTDLAAEQRPWYEQPMKLGDIRSCISASFQSMKREYVAIGYYLKRAEREALYLEDGYSSIWEFAQEEYGLSKSSASRYMSINTKFSVDGNSPILQDQYKAYSKSQLQEMLYLEDEKLEQVNPEMRVQDIREMRQPKEKAYNIPYFELEGQLNIEKDFPEYLPDVMTARPEADAMLPSSPFTMDISDMLPALGPKEGVAISQQQNKHMISAPTQTDAAGECHYRPGYPCSLAPEAIDAEFSEGEEPDGNLTDLEIARQELERANNLLAKCLKDLPDENNVHIRGMKLKVAALASLVCDLDDMGNPPPKPEQPAMPILRNNDQRKEWLESFRSWPVWFEVPEASEVYYRYELPDGSSIVVCEYRYWVEWMERYADESPDKAGERVYLLEPGYHYLHDCLTSRTMLVEKLKEIQRKG